MLRFKDKIFGERRAEAEAADARKKCSVAPIACPHYVKIREIDHVLVLDAFCADIFID